MRALFFGLAALAAPLAALADAPRLGLPLACTPGRDCWVQQYPDHDPSAAARDYMCGAQTYDGHDGTDIRVLDTGATVDVVASAAGTVQAVRDGVDDHLMRTEADRTAVGNRECGNGVLVSHGDGWETQYCHLRRGTVAVKVGDTVAAGTKLGTVGYSGMAAFPHVHLSVRKDGKAIDPFRAGSMESCGGTDAALWTSDALASMAYQRGTILRSGFAPGPVDLPVIEDGGLADATLQPDWPAAVSFVWAINLEAGDEVRVRLDGPGDLDAENSVTLDRPKAQYLLFAGKKRPGGGWPAGTYQTVVEIGQKGAPRLRQSHTAVIP